MNEVTLALLPALIPDTLLPQTPSWALLSYPISAAGTTGWGQSGFPW